MPPRDQARDSLNRRRSQVTDALKNGISAALGGAIDSEAITLSSDDERRIMDSIAKQGENFAAQIVAGKKAELDKVKAEARAAALQKFGSPAFPARTDLNTPSSANSGYGSTNSDEKVPANFARAETNETTPSENAPASTSLPEDEEKDSPQTNPNEENPATEAPEDNTDGQKYGDGLKNEGLNGGSNQDQGGGLKYCPTDGQILNPDGTCPAGDHSALGRQTPPPIPPQARGNQQTPPPIPPQAVIMASVQSEGNKKMAGLNQQLQAAKKELASLKEDVKKVGKKALILRIIGGCGCITIITPIIVAIFLFLNHQKNSKIEKEIKRVEEQINNLEKERVKTAKQYNLKT